MIWNTNWECGDNHGIENQIGYGICSGTSMSAPHVTGLAGIIRSIDPLIDRLAVQHILKTSSSKWPSRDTELGYGIPNATVAVEKALGTVNGAVLENRLTPLFSFYSAAAEDSFYTTVPQMATAAIEGTLLPQPSTSVGYLPAYGFATPHYVAFPDEPGDGFSPPLPVPTPRAEVYLFTTEKNPINAAEPLVPLYRMSYQGTNGGNSLNLDHFYTTEQAGITFAENAGYALDGIEGYIFSNAYPQPVDTIGLYRRYNPNRDDHAVFPEDQLSQMASEGYTQSSGTSGFIGYVYANQDADNDYLIDGFEKLIGTCVNNPDSDEDGLIDSVAVYGYPRENPINGSCAFVPATTRPWRDNAIGTLYKNLLWEGAYGYHFTPLVNGTIDKLGGYFNGTKQVKLFNKASGELLAEATVTAHNWWRYSSITPVNVLANETYTVAINFCNPAAFLIEYQIVICCR